METSVLKAWAHAQVALTEQVSTSVVAVVTGRRHSIAGILWAPNTIVTAAEAIAAGGELSVSDGTAGLHAAERVAVDLATDVAILRAPVVGNPATRGDSATLRGGQPVLIAGRNRQASLSRWATIAQIGPAWHSRRGGSLERAIRLSPGLDPELEGSGVFDVEGRLCAMAVRGPRGRVIGIPTETIVRVTALVDKHGYLPQAYLGLILQSVFLDERNRGVSDGQARALMVMGVDPASPAALAGIQLGDVLLRLDDEPLDELRTVTRAMIAGGVGHTMRFDMLRGGQRQEVVLQTGERPRR
jgi:S1-C subfamily serine protease